MARVISVSTFQYSKRALKLVWQTSGKLLIWLVCFSLVAGLLPAAIAYVGKLIVDTVVSASNGSAEARDIVWWWLGLEMALVLVRAGAQKGIGVMRELLRALLGQKVNVLILEKATTLTLKEFEDSEFYDRLTRARREASSRPLSLVMRFFGIVQDLISLASYAALLFLFSPLAMLIVIVAAIPAFVTQTKFSGAAFRLFQWKTPEKRQQIYLETLLAREDYAKEVSLFGLGDIFLKRYKDIFESLYKDDRNLSVRRGFWGFVMETLSTVAFYGAYAWIVYSTVIGELSLGEMTMYVMIFKQAQSSFASIMTSISGMYEDNLYLSNLFNYLDAEVSVPSGENRIGKIPGDGIRFKNVSFTYPGADKPAIVDLNMHIPDKATVALVGHNGSGKTTLVKLLTRLYEPDSGTILVDGSDTKEWNTDALRRKIGVIFQDFARYQLMVGENIGVGDTDKIDQEGEWAKAAELGLASEFIDELPDKYRTQLGRWFKNGRELSGGQWQKVALARAFIRDDADILILDEPTAAIDAEAEMQIFEHFHAQTKERIAVLISHRFSTVRHADTIYVFKDGRLVEQGPHQQLIKDAGLYADLFHKQAEGYQ